MAEDDDSTDSSAEDDELVQVNHMVPRGIKEQAKQKADQWGELSDAVRRVYRIIARRGEFGDKGELEVELLKAKHDRERLEEQIDELSEQLSVVTEREKEIEEQIATREERESTYESHLEEIESEIRSGQSVFPEHGMVEEAASVGNTNPMSVIDELRDRNPDLPDAAFKKKQEGGEVWTGTESTFSVNTDE